jgi:hypothetical protein
VNSFYLLDTSTEYFYLLDAAEVFISKLLPKHSSLDISIEVLDGLLDGFAEGFTENLDNLKKPKEFIISLSNKSENILKTLAHECIHVKQYVRTLSYCEEEAYANEQTIYELYKGQI